ncbi:unnamed protein product, partial [Amoebophrya sp. A25]
AARRQTAQTYYQYKRPGTLAFLESVSAEKYVGLRQTWHGFHGLWSPEHVGASSLLDPQLEKQAMCKYGRPRNAAPGVASKHLSGERRKRKTGVKSNDGR